MIIRRLLLLTVLCAAFTACSGADWKSREQAQAYAAPGQAQIVIQMRATNQDGLAEAASEFETALVSELAERGIDAKRAAGGTSGNVKLDILRWDPGSRAGRAFVGAFGVGKAEIEVHVLVAAVDGSTQLNGVVVGYVNSGFFGGSATTAAEEAAVAIAEGIAGPAE